MMNGKPATFKFMIRYSIFVTIGLFVCSGAMAEDFVPFVIPARPNPDSPIAYPSSKPIKTNSDHLVAKRGCFSRGKHRVRLWGVNLSFGANLPKHEDAPHIAARLAAAGVNTVRCHHMDTARWPRGLCNARDGKTIAPEALDRLDYFIDQLARHGIYVNINLHVGRVHSRFLGLPKTNRQYDKISNIFTPALIDAQKQYARELLTHINQYRKVRYADDPAVAIVEITNENSFFMWGSEQTLRTLPPYYANILQNKFNTWLQKQYGSTDKLRAAWDKGAQPLGKNLLINGNFHTIAAGRGVPENWHIEQHSGCKASVSRIRYKGKDTLRIDIGKANDTEWHLQLNQRDFAVKAGRYYTVVFDAAADKTRKIGCSVSQAHSPWSNLGLSQGVELTSNWQTFRYSFAARADDDNARISFSFGGGKVPFYLANVEFRPGGRIGLHKAESVETDSVTLFADSETSTRILDRMRFLTETEKAYFDGMRNFIKKDLGCRAIVTGTIVFGPLGLYTQSDMDFIDAHAYWQHPRFPGRPWDSGNWLINQRAMTDYPNEATLFRLAANRLDGKPFTVSEYNHPAPLDSQAECVPMVASFAAAQDWDGVWLYTYSHSSDDWDRENLNSYFDIDTNPAKWGFMRAGTAIFHDTSIGAPSSACAVVPLADSSDVVGALAKLHLEHDRDMFAVLAKRGSITREKMLETQFAATFGNESFVRLLYSSHPKLGWSVENGKGIYTGRGQRASVYTGHAARFAKSTDGKISIVGPDFVAVTVTALDKEPLDQSKKILITACGRCENTGMKFSEDRRTVGRNWGGPPVQIEAVEGTLVLNGNWTCQALGPDGMPKRRVAVLSEEMQSHITLSHQYETIWYLVTRRTKPD